jgi:hypothetical protein
MLLPLVVLLVAPAAEAEPPPDPDRVPAIAAAEGVEIHAIRIHREKASYAAKGADITNMELSLWFPTQWETQGRAFSVKLLELGPIEDDRGVTLMTKERLRSLQDLKNGIRARETQSFRSGDGPVVYFTVDVPSREATKLKALKGKAEISLLETKVVSFDKMPERVGKPLEHDLLKELKVVPRFKRERGDTEVILQVPEAHAALVDWDVEHEGRRLRISSEGVAPGKEGVELSKSYRGALPDGWKLRLAIAVPVKTKVVEFHFKDVELP